MNFSDFLKRPLQNYARKIEQFNKTGKFGALAKHASLPKPFLESRLKENKFCHTSSNKVTDDFMNRMLGPDTQMIKLAE